MNNYFTPTGNPITLARGVSATIRAESALVEAGFDKLPALTGNEYKIVYVNSAGTALEGFAFGAGNQLLGMNPAGTAYEYKTLGVDVQAYNADLAAIAALSSVGIAARTASNTWALRTISAGAGCVITNGDGVSGNPTIALTPGVGLGDVLGPAGAIDGAVAVFDGITGKVIKQGLVGITTVITATTATTLTNNKVLLQITPASYGVAVTLPDATTCAEGGPLHIIDNRGVYPVRVLDSTGVLKGFIYAGVVSYISLDDNSTAAGVWAIENNELVGVSAQSLTVASGIKKVFTVVDMGSGKEMLVGRDSTSSGGNVYACVYDAVSNTFGSATLVRSGTIYEDKCCALLVGTNKVMIVSAVTTAFEAVILSVSGATITVNAAAAATLSANLSNFSGAYGNGFVACGSSFVVSYVIASGNAQIRALTYSDTTVTIGDATSLGSTNDALIIATGDKVLTASSNGSSLYVGVYTISGTTITAGTGASGAVGNARKFFQLGSRWCVVGEKTSAATYGTVVSLTGTTVTISSAQVFSTGYIQDVIVVGSRVLAMNNQTTNNVNILTDTAGTASAGTAITLTGATARYAIHAVGTDVVVQENSLGNAILIYLLDCSGASPVVSNYTALNAASEDYCRGTYGCDTMLRRSSCIYMPLALRKTYKRVTPIKIHMHCALLIKLSIKSLTLTQVASLGGGNQILSAGFQIQE